MKGKATRAAGLTILVALVWACPPGRGETYHVAPHGSDPHAGSRTRPFRTIQRAADITRPGDTVIVLDGVYGWRGKHLPLDIKRSGLPDAWITFKAENKWKAILTGRNKAAYYINFHGPLSYIRVEGFQIKNCRDGGFMCQTTGRKYPHNTHHIVIRDNYVHHIGNYETETNYGIVGIYVGSLNSHITLDSNVWHDIGRTGPEGRWLTHDHALYLAHWPPGPCHHITATNNIAFYCSGHAFAVGCNDSKIINNTLAWSNTSARGGTPLLSLDGDLRNVTIHNNIFYEPPESGDGAAVMWAPGKMTNVVFRNNIVLGGRWVIRAHKPDLLTQDNRIVDPKFINVSNDRNPNNDDWRLQPDSPAIDAGHASKAPSHDCAGNPRPQGGGFDIGAHEYVAGDAPVLKLPATTGPGQDEKMLQEIARALRFGPLFELNKRFELARKTYQEVIDRYPEHPEIEPVKARLKALETRTRHRKP